VAVVGGRCGWPRLLATEVAQRWEAASETPITEP